jgi:hypothetical protein
MGKGTRNFDEEGGTTFDPDKYQSTMRVALHHRHQVPFAYTLDIHPKAYTQLTPHSYREAGTAILAAVGVMLLDQVPLNVLMSSYTPPVFRPISELIN